MILALLAASAVAQAAHVEPGLNRQSAARQFQVDATFIDTTTGQWSSRKRPTLIRRPTLDDFTRAAGPGSLEDFGLSFNCRVAKGEKLDDCRLLYTVPGGADGQRLMRVIAPLVRLSDTSAALARDKAYRVTINAALNVMTSYGMPQQCNPPFCMIEGMQPPPPPPVPADPVARDALARAETCWSDRWEKARIARFAAEKAVRESAPAPGSETARAAALTLVHSRQALMACITDLEAASRAAPFPAADRKIIADRVKSMRSGWFGQTKYEVAILIGLIDKSASAAEDAIFYPY